MPESTLKRVLLYSFLVLGLSCDRRFPDTNMALWSLAQQISGGQTTTQAGVTVLPTSISTYEGDQNQSFFVVLNTAPTANVVLPVTNGNTGQIAILSPFTGASGSLTFTPSNWNTPQAVVLNAFENGVIDSPGPVSLTITLGPDTTTADTAYRNLTPPAVTVSVSHSDKHAFLIRVTPSPFLIAGYTGSMVGGSAGADALCMAAPNYPGSGTYRALIADVNRRACTSSNCQTGGTTEHLNWVLQPHTMYFMQYYDVATHSTLAGFFQSFRTNANGIYNFQAGRALINPFWEGPTNYGLWTGLMGDWTTSANTCTNWTSTIPTGGSGSTLDLSVYSISLPPATACTTAFTILCVEQ